MGVESHLFFQDFIQLLVVTCSNLWTSERFEKKVKTQTQNYPSMKVDVQIYHVWKSSKPRLLKFMFSKKATNIDKIFTVDLTVTTYCQIDGEDFFNFCGFLRKREL